MDLEISKKYFVFEDENLQTWKINYGDVLDDMNEYLEEYPEHKSVFENPEHYIKNMINDYHGPVYIHNLNKLEFIPQRSNLIEFVDKTK